MPEGYTHLAYEQRCQIYGLLKSNFSQKSIAKELRVSQSTISREISRNIGGNGYRYKQAHRKAVERRTKAVSGPRKMVPSVLLYVNRMLTEKQWSPEQIVGRLKIDTGISISYEWIYQYIWQDKQQGGDLYKHLRRGGKKYNKRGNGRSGRGYIPGRVGIEERPQVVETKERVGDFEIDTIIGTKHRGAIVSIVDRKTKVTRLGLLNSTKADETGLAIVQLLSPIKEHVYTLTADNGKEFSQHAMIARTLKAQVFFANPYSAWERGLNENTNGLVRQYFPKKCDFTKLTHEQIKRVEYLLNTRPRKSLNFKTPYEVFLQETGVSLGYALRS